jgi:predicted ATP-grasp superfamily ATP-dependent carboligase
MTCLPRILLSEGSSLSAREAITAFGLAGHRVDVVTSEPFCLGRFSRFVRRVHRAPPSGADPGGYLAAVLGIVAQQRIDALIPVHEQAYLFAAARHWMPASLAVALADFAAFEQVQSKAAFSALLDRLDVPQPTTAIIRSADDLRAERAYPFFLKAVFGTASVEVWRIDDREQLDALLPRLEACSAFEDGLIAQAAISGALERTQAVFDRGRLVASHIYRQVAEGPGGGDVLKRSVNRPEARSLVERIGAALAWHGALSFDYIVETATGTPRFIDANPRLVEPMNARLSGTDLADALLRVTLGVAQPRQSEGRSGVLTRLGLMGLLDAARRRRLRRDVLAELSLLLRGSGRYKDAGEELTPLRTDPWSAIPFGLVVAKLLFDPASAGQMAGRTVRAYSLTAAAVHHLRASGSRA